MLTWQELLDEIYKGENPLKGTYKRNHEGDYHAKEYEVRAMIRDQSAEGNDSTILEYYTMDDIDKEALKRYRIMFNTSKPDHVWRGLTDKEFLEMLGGYRRDRRDKIEGLTVAGLMMFGKGLAIREEFHNIFMDYRDETGAIGDYRWTDRITYDGTWENNLFNFLIKVLPKLTENLKKPFVLDKYQRIDDTPVHKAIREAFVNLIIHSDYRMDSGVLKIIKTAYGFIFSNPGNLKLPKEQIYRGGDSKARNPHMQTMLHMIGFGDNAGSGFPDIIKAWKNYGWVQPELVEDTIMNQVTLTLKFILENVEEVREEKWDIMMPTPSTPNLNILSESVGGLKGLELRNRILMLIKQNPKISKKKISQELGVSVYALKKELAAMGKDHVAEFVGYSRNGKWVVY